MTNNMVMTDPVKEVFEKYYAPCIFAMVEKGEEIAGKIFHLTFRPPTDKIAIFEGPMNPSSTEFAFLTKELSLPMEVLASKLGFARSTGHIFVYVDYASYKGYFIWRPILE